MSLNVLCNVSSAQSNSNRWKSKGSLKMLGVVPNLVLIFIIEVQGNIYLDVASFCSNNGLNYATVSSLPYLKKETFQISKHLFARNLQLRQLKYNQIKESYRMHEDSLVLMAKSGQLEVIEEFVSYLSILSLIKIKRGLLVFTTPFDQKHRSLLQSVVDLIDYNSLFYIAFRSTENFKTQYLQVITVKKAKKGIINPVKLNGLTGMIIEEYDLQGLVLQDLTIAWAPYYIIKNCDQKGRNCDTSGFYHDFTAAMGKIMNFTWETQKELSGNWGVAPISGPFNKSGTWGGVMGGIINGDYMISLCQWVWNYERYGLVDFVSTSADANLLALTPSQPQVDLGLFIRPFTNEAWKGNDQVV